MLPALASTTEGATRLFVPRASLAATEPKTQPIFFNPAARVNRDISVAVTSATGGRTFCDVLTGVGSRGVRIAKEVPRDMEVVLNDFNRLSLQIAKRNARLNRVTRRCGFSHDEANHFLHSRFGRDERFDYLDIDPFGSPAPFIQGALASAANHSVISLTATDTPVLCGVYPKVSSRRYGSVSRRTEFKHETAVRILVHFCSRLAAMGDIGVEPIAEHSTRHYLRIFFRVERSAASADHSISHSGYVSSCQSCGERAVSESPTTVCTKCASRVQPAGPLWLGPLTDQRVVRDAAIFSARKNLKEAAAILDSLGNVNNYPPFSYDLESICSRLKIPSVPHQRVLERLAEEGYSAMKQPFEKSGLKTRAPLKEVCEAVRRASSSHSQAD